jgi:rhodanese-related sulfurtransferase
MASTPLACQFVASLSELQPELSPREVAEHIDQVQLVDVREPYEFEAGRIAGARHVELARLAEEAESLDRDRPLVFYCRVGARSAVATQAFRASGYDAHNLAGGLLAWADSGLPVDGRVAEH